MSKPPDRYRGSADFGKAMSLAFEFAGAVALFWFIGRLLDGWWDTDPWAQVAGGVVGWIGGIVHVYVHTQGRGKA
ncbi:MAG: AtpZ/AtpI family protein [Actinomycetota bacterium]|nr:AtpZ/AtpI family protein [Actinomycetota bacterium]